MIGQPRSNQRSVFVTGLLSASLVAAAAGSAVAQDAASSLDPAADLSTQQLVISNWADYMPEELPANFEAEFGTPVTVTNHATNEEIMAKLTAGGDSGIDVAFVSGQFAQALASQGLLEPIHHDLIPNLANLYPEATELAYDPGNVYSVPYAWGTTGLCYREDLVGYAPDSWYDLLTPRRERDRQDHRAGHRALADAARPEGARLLRQHHRPGRDGGRSRSCSSRPSRPCWPTTTPPSTAGSCRARPRWSRRGTAGATTASATRTWAQDQVRRAQGGQRPVGGHDGHPQDVARTRRPPTPSSTTSCGRTSTPGWPRTSCTRCPTRRPWSGRRRLAGGLPEPGHDPGRAAQGRVARGPR